MHRKVAVLTPVYNGAAFLRETLASVQAQSYPSIVHCVLDNASTDSTPQILGEFRDSRVPLIVKRNAQLLPIARNWNTCLDMIGADVAYFRILCADDTMPPDSVEKMVALAQSDPNIAVVGCQRQTSQGMEEFNWDKGRRTLSGPEAVRACLMGTTGMAPPHLLYNSRVLFLRAPLFDEEILAFDTEAAFFILSQSDAKFGFVHEALGFTRRHAGSMTEQTVAVMHTDYFDWLVMLLRYGPAVLTPVEFKQQYAAFRRHYLGRLLVWRFKHGNRKAFRWHISAMKVFGRSPRAEEYLDAIADYCMRKLGLRKNWDGYPNG